MTQAMHSALKSISLRAVGVLLLSSIAMSLPAPALSQPLPLDDSDLAGVSALGSITLGSYTWTDDHQFDASTNKGALVMGDYAQQYATGEIIVNATQSSIATGVTSIGSISSTGSTISITNTNESTAFVGGF